MAFVGIPKTLTRAIASRFPVASFPKFIFYNARQMKSATFDKEGTLSPQEFDLSYIMVPIDLHYAENLLVPSFDVMQLAEKLNRKYGLNKLPFYESLNQIDFTWVNDAYRYVYKKILEVLERYEPTDDNFKAKIFRKKPS